MVEVTAEWYSVAVLQTQETSGILYLSARDLYEKGGRHNLVGAQELQNVAATASHHSRWLYGLEESCDCHTRITITRLP